VAVTVSRRSSEKQKGGIDLLVMGIETFLQDRDAEARSIAACGGATEEWRQSGLSYLGELRSRQNFDVLFSRMIGGARDVKLLNQCGPLNGRDLVDFRVRPVRRFPGKAVGPIPYTRALTPIA